MKPIIKVCGNTDSEIIKLCISLGAKLIGFIVNYSKSPRSISIDKLKILTKNIPKNIKKVAVMVDPTIENVKEISNYCDIIQLHGEETDKFIQQIKKETNLEIMKAIKIKEKKDLDLAEEFPTADIILFDTPSMGQAGQAFDFNLLKNIKTKNFFIAGKISKDNVHQALKFTNKIDVNSALETDGYKDKNKVIDFFKNLNG